MFQLYFTSLHIALLDEDDEDFFAGRPLATADAKAVAMSLRVVVGKSITAPTLTPAWETSAHLTHTHTHTHARARARTHTHILTSVRHNAQHTRYLSALTLSQHWMPSLQCSVSCTIGRSAGRTSTWRRSSCRARSSRWRR